ncbi:hypothetical protein GCM10025867_50010 (plasmid) [Frondihabitans sucicola]|uniref:Uncharacterized protein n=1 Tax=Frondihabitans sucicola TaxID=1268041 RepID=A0ABM8GW96_9MICO|nr:hypothetical protein [Frondihabitans sucicola]BDZ52760.1 hypothetical protein GCM10025867_50010 [Frondihabitans sucicola]
MGSIGVYVTDNPAFGRAKGESDISYFLRDRAETLFLAGTTPPETPRRREIVAHNSTADAFYMAIRIVDDGDFLPKGSVFAEVILKSWHGKGDRREFIYKSQWEGMGLGAGDAGPSLKVLDALTPAEDMGLGEETTAWIATWRTGCRALAERPKPKVDDVIEFPSAFRFGDGVWRGLFRITQGGKLVDALTGARVSLTKWHARDYSVVSREAFEAAAVVERARRASAVRDTQLTRLFQAERANYSAMIDEARRRGEIAPPSPTYASLLDSWAQMPGDIRDDLSPYLEDAEVEEHLASKGDSSLPWA